MRIVLFLLVRKFQAQVLHRHELTNDHSGKFLLCRVRQEALAESHKANIFMDVNRNDRRVVAHYILQSLVMKSTLMTS